MSFIQVKVGDIRMLIEVEATEDGQVYRSAEVELPIDDVCADAVFLPVMVVKEEKDLAGVIAGEDAVDDKGLGLCL